MPVTLAEAKLNVLDDLQAMTIDEYAKSNFIWNHIIFDDSWTAPELKTALRPLAIFLKDSAQAPLTTS